MKKLSNVFLSGFQYESNIAHGEVNWEKKFKETMDRMLNIRSMSAAKFGRVLEDNTQNACRIIRNQSIGPSEVTIVLLGADTWKSRKVDHEIFASLEKCDAGRRCGLIGIFLPDHPDYGQERYDPYTIPPRLYDNVRKRYAKLYDWTEDLLLIHQWLGEAKVRCIEKLPTNSYPLYTQDLAVDQTYWLHH